jgi:hypothetical protein
MKLYCIEAFKNEVEKLSKNNSYASLPEDIIEYFFGKETSELMNGRRINRHPAPPFIKKRLDGRGGYRMYFVILIKDDCIYLTYVHAKAGSAGSENLADGIASNLLRETLDAIKSNDLYELTPNDDRKKIIFSKKPILVAALIVATASK